MSLSETEREKIMVDLRTDVFGRIDDCVLLSGIRDKAHSYLPKKLEEVMASLLNKAGNKDASVYATAAEKQVTFKKHILVSEEDVTKYADTVKKHYLNLLLKGKRIEV